MVQRREKGLHFGGGTFHTSTPIVPLRLLHLRVRILLLTGPRPDRRHGTVILTITTLAVGPFCTQRLQFG